ncbi:uncharacterized protein LOC119604692 [Lucilia sericata]|uniref:uncharacterized protein LOC119604692 n=1 Tax=Lucilia sericata TaxID=13632 RepID=UPI0018A7FA3D|nr:uncharacterized protein LOC119604692 [Lucilia sericata]
MNLTGLLNFESVIVKGAQTQSNELNTFVANSLRIIVEEFFLKVAPSFVIVVSCRRQSPLNFYLNIMQHLFNMVDNMIVQLVFVDYKKPVRIEGLRYHNLLLVDSLEAFLDIDVVSYSRDYDTNEYYHIFLMQRDRHLQNDMKGIFDYCWTNHIINCNVQLQTALGEYKCGNTIPEKINQFINDSWLNQGYFLPKLKNFQGCPLVAAVRNIPPYTYPSGAKDGVMTYSGFEMDVIKHLAKRMNFSLSLRTKIHDDRLAPFGNGALKMLDDHTADIVFGFYRKRTSMNVKYSTTMPHYQNYIVSVVYLPAHRLKTFEVLSYPFPNCGWYALAVTTFIIILFTRLLRLHQSQSIPTFSMIACALGSPIHREPQLPTSVLIFITWLWSTFLLRSIYSGLLFHLFRNEIHASLPHNLDEAVNASYRAVMNLFTYNDIKYIPFYQRSPNHSSIVIDSSDELIPIAYLENNYEENFYAVVSQEFLIHYTEKYKKPGLFYIIPEIIMQQRMCFYLEKHSYLINQLDAEIMDIHAVGLIGYWAKNFINSKYLNSKHMFQDARIEQDDLWGIYMICSACYLVAFVIF